MWANRLCGGARSSRRRRLLRGSRRRPHRRLYYKHPRCARERHWQRQLRSGDELKLIYPQPGLMPEDVAREGADFRHWWLQPMDGPELAENTRRAVQQCLREPRWRLSLQTHKFIGIA